MKSGSDNLAHDHEARRVVAPTTQRTALSNASMPNQANFVSANAHMFVEPDLVIDCSAHALARDTDTLHHTVEPRRHLRKKLRKSSDALTLSISGSIASRTLIKELRLLQPSIYPYIYGLVSRLPSLTGFAGSGKPYEVLHAVDG